jgi:WD40 repeat protein
VAGFRAFPRIRLVVMRDTLHSLARALSQASSILSETPDQVFPQMYNRLRFDASQNESLNEVLEVGRNLYRRSWLRLLGNYQPNRGLLRSLEGHDSGVSACAFSPDGEIILSTGSSELRVWDAPTGRLLATLPGYYPWVQACAFSPDGTRFALGEWDCAFSPDGRTIASAGSDGTVKLRRAKWPRAQHPLEAIDYFIRFALGSDREPPTAELFHGGEVRACAFRPDGKHIVSASGGSIKVWDAITLQEIATLSHAHPDLPRETDDSSEVEPNQGTAGGKLDAVTVLTFNSDGTRLLSGGVSCWQPRLWNTKDWTEIPLPRSLLDRCEALSNRNALSFSPDGKLVASGGIDHQLRVWDIKRGLTLASFKAHRHRVTDCCWSPDGTKILSASEDGTLQLWQADLETLATAQSQTPNHDGPVYACAWSLDGTRVVSGSMDGTVGLWDVATGEEVRRFTHKKYYSVNCCALSPSGLIVSGGEDGTLKLWDVESGEQRASFLAHADGVLCCAFSPDGKRIASGGTDRLLKLWDCETGDELLVLEGHTLGVRACSFSRDGLLIASAGDTTVRVWDGKTGAAKAILRGHKAGLVSCSLSPDGTRAVSSSEAGFLKLWAVAAQREIATLREHRAAAACSFSPDGKRIISAGWVDELVLWDAEARKAIAILRGVTGGLNTCAFGPDGQTIVCGGSPGHLLLLSVEEGDSSNSEALSPMEVLCPGPRLVIEESVIRLVPHEICKARCLIPIRKVGTTVTVAMADAMDVVAIDEVAFVTGMGVEPVVEDKSVIEETITHYYGS